MTELENPRCAFIDNSSRYIKYTIRICTFFNAKVWNMEFSWGGDSKLYIGKRRWINFLHCVLSKFSSHEFCSSCRRSWNTWGNFLLSIHCHENSILLFQEISEEEYFALSVVTYIGCGISIVCLAMSIVVLLSLG